MKVLAALSVLQIAAIVFLASRIMALEPVVDESAPPGANEPIVKVPEVAPPEASPEPGRFLDERELRRIVREELAAQLGAIDWPQPPAEALAAVDPIDPIERQQQLEWVGQEIDRYIGRGEISDLEMEALQMEMAKLDKEGQKRMLGRIVRAMNAGELKGRL